MTKHCRLETKGFQKLKKFTYYPWISEQFEAKMLPTLKYYLFINYQSSQEQISKDEQ